MSELIDLVNARGEIVRREVPRDDADTYDGLYMRIIIMVIFNSVGNILVHKRAAQKSVSGGYIDHVCGAILSGENPIAAGAREAHEEVRVQPLNIRVVEEGLNVYNRWRVLLIGDSDELPAPDSLDSTEVEWAQAFPLDALKTKAETCELKFVSGFFGDANKAIAFMKTAEADEQGYTE